MREQSGVERYFGDVDQCFGGGGEGLVPCAGLIDDDRQPLGECGGHIGVAGDGEGVVAVLSVAGVGHSDDVVGMGLEVVVDRDVDHAVGGGHGHLGAADPFQKGRVDVLSRVSAAQDGGRR